MEDEAYNVISGEFVELGMLHTFTQLSPEPLEPEVVVVVVVFGVADVDNPQE